jgi:DNA-binding response OmpR family regulator
MVLTADAASQDRIAALDAGADDYVVKPFDIGEVLARARAVLRRSAPIPAAWAGGDFGDLVIDGPTRRVLVRGVAISLTRREFDLLAALAECPGRVFTRTELLGQVWNSEQDWQDPATVTEHVYRLRAKIELDTGDPRWIQTVRHLGYAFSASSGESCSRVDRSGPRARRRKAMTAGIGLDAVGKSDTATITPTTANTAPLARVRIKRGKNGS